MNHISSEQKALLALLQRALRGEACSLPEEVNWDSVAVLAREQAVIPFAYDGAVAMGAEVPSEILQKWKTTMLRGVVRNERLLLAQDEIIGEFAKAGIPAVVLKGSSVARYYPQPSLRILGDIDILVGKENVEKAHSVLVQLGFSFRESDHAFHLSFARPDAYVEIHYDVTKLPDSVGGRLVGEKTARFLEDIGQGAMEQHVFPVLSETNQAISLLLHMIRHMFGTGIGLRQVCDWAVYVAGTDKDHFVKATIPVLEECGLMRYAQIATKACVQYLGFRDLGLSWCANIGERECQLFIAGIFSGGNMGEANKEGLGSLFTSKEIMGNKNSSFYAFILKMNRLAYKNFPVTRKIKILLPLCWVYLPVRYLVRAALGLRPSKKVGKVIASAQNQRKLYEVLKPFEVEK